MSFFLSKRVFVLALAGFAMRAQAEPLADVLARLDAAARQVHSFSAAMKRTDFTSVLNETEVMHGTIRIRRGKGGTAGVMDFTDPNPYSIGIGAHTVQRYYPKAGVVEVYDTTKYTSVMDEYGIAEGLRHPDGRRGDARRRFRHSYRVDAAFARSLETYPQNRIVDQPGPE
jgi:hypothetical protein